MPLMDADASLAKTLDSPDRIRTDPELEARTQA